MRNSCKDPMERGAGHEGREGCGPREAPSLALPSQVGTKSRIWQGARWPYLRSLRSLRFQILLAGWQRAGSDREAGSEAIGTANNAKNANGGGPDTDELVHVSTLCARHRPLSPEAGTPTPWQPCHQAASRRRTRARPHWMGRFMPVHAARGGGRSVKCEIGARTLWSGARGMRGGRTLCNVRGPTVAARPSPASQELRDLSREERER